MTDQTANDFWKEKLILIQRENSRMLEPVKDLEAVCEEISGFENKFTQVRSEVEKSSGYVSWVLTLSSDFQIRLFIQRQTKISFMGKTSTGFEKIADAKLFNSPFLQISHFVRHFDSYTVELSKTVENAYKSEKQKKIQFEFIKAVLSRKFQGTETTFFAEIQNDRFRVVLKSPEEEKEILFTSADEVFTEFLK